MDTNVADRPDTPTVGSVCHALVSSIHQTSTNVTAFVRRCRSARADLGPAMRELSELQMVLELLGDYSVSTEERRRQQCTAATIPGEIQTHLRPILTDCITTVLCIDGILQQHGSEKGDGSLVKWTAHGRNDLRELDETLAVYRAVLGLVSDLVSLLISSGSEGQPGDGTSPRVGGMTPDGMRLPDVLRELEVLRSSTFVGPGSREALAAQQLALQVHLGHIITYAKALATSEDGEKAVKAMDEAQKKNAATEKEEARGSIPVPAPLRRFPTTRDAGGVGDNFIVLNKGFENLLVRDDGGRSTGLLFAPHGTPEPGSFMAGGPSTGMMIMDGAGLPGMSGTNTSLQPIRPSNSALTSTRKNFVRRTSAQQQHAMIYTTEKEVAVSRPAGEEVTEEALAFAQVPVHILGRLSLNLVGHVYTGTTTPPPLAAELYPENMSGSSDQTSYVQSLSTMRTDGEYFDDAASARTSDMGSLHDGDLQFSQLDPLKPPAAVTLQPLPPPQTIFASQISLGSQRKPASDLEHVPSPPPPSSSQPPPPHYMYSQPLPLLPTAQPLPPLPTEQPLPPLPPSSQQSQSHSTIPTPTPAFSNPVSSAAPPPPPPAVVPQNGHPHHERAASASASTQSVVYHGPPRPPPSRDHGHTQSLREMRSISTMNTHTFINMQKPLPRTPLVYIPSYPGPFVKTKAVVVGNFSSGKTCMITRMSRGHFPRSKHDKCSITETVRISVDDEPIELSLWDIRGIDYDPTWLKDAHVALVCFSVNIGSTDSKGKHLGRWVAEVNRNCPGASILLVGLKTDIRFHARSVEKLHQRGKGLVTPEQGAMFRDNIGASRYLECSARTGDGVLEVLGETARVAMQVKKAQYLRKHGGGDGGGGGGKRPLSRIGRFLGIGGNKK